jgi:hypothetical protein
MDINKLLTALENDNNESVIQLNYEKIANEKNTILQQLHLPKELLKTLSKQLKAYRYVDNLDDLRYGSYIRWISLKNKQKESVRLTNGGLLCHMKQVDDDIHLVCKNSMGMLFQLKMTENIIFQKLNEQEQVILSALKYLEG